MADNWSGESGILRKTKTCEADELLVFGYSCKLFRDDEKALLIDQGKHLIPWMGDESLKIDRYDGRGALFDLGRYEAPPGGFSTHWTGLSEDEQRAEQLCDEERYLALYHNESEEEVYREEELKRLHQDYAGTYGQVPYSYDGQNDQVAADNINEEVAAEDNQPFLPPAHLDIPVNMVLPDTVKLNAIIEKTAMFINQQGTQMEILLKAKQKNNPQFEFLNHDCPLYRYYRHLLMAMKTGRYKPAIEQAPEEEAHIEEEESTDYLHPSLASNFTKPDLAPPPRPLPPIVYKPSANCAYSMLVNKIKGTSSNIPEPVIQEEQSNPSDQTTANYDNYYYSDEYRQYYMQYYMHQYANNMEISRAPVIYNKDTAQEHNGFQESYDPEKPTTSEHIMIGPQIPATVNDSVVSTSEKESAIKDAVLKDDQKPNDSKAAEKASKKKKIVIGALAQYCNSDSESDSEEEQESVPVIAKHNPSANDINKINNKVIIVPSDDTKVIIHKMASYVAKNGREFEQIVSSKGDPRFKFLQSYHEHHPYYLQKLQGYLGPERVLENYNTHNQNPKSPRKTPTKSKVIGPVSFSIKKTKDTEALPLKPALSIESSSDEDADKKDAAENLNADSQLTENDTTKLAEEQESSTVKPQDSNVEVQNNQVEDKINIVEETTTEESYTDEISVVEQKGIKEDESPISDSKENEQDDDIVEISSEELLESKPIENKLREKLAVMQQKSSKNKEKQLQLERKKRALAFLNQLKATSDIPKQIEIEHSEEQQIISYDYNSSDSNISLIEKLDSPRINYTEQQVQNNNHKRRSRTRSRSRSERREKKKTRKRSNSRSSTEYSPRRHRDGREKSRKSKKKSRSHSHDNKRSSKKRSKNYTDSY